MKGIIKTTTVQVYKEDLTKLEKLCKKGENFRDKFHEIIKQNET